MAARRHALQVWATLVYWMGKATGVLVTETEHRSSTDTSQHKTFTTASKAGRRRWARTRAWNAACLAVVVHRVSTVTWPDTVQTSCYDIVCDGGEDMWCVFACLHYAVQWLDRMSEIVALMAAITWRQRSTVECLNAATAMCLDDDDDVQSSALDVPWHAYLIVAFPVFQFALAAKAVSPVQDGVWRTATYVASAAVSCAPVVTHGVAAAVLVVADNSMLSINRHVTRLASAGQLRGRADRDQDRRQITAIERLARRQWLTTELVTGGVCDAFGVDLMAAVILAVARVTFVAITVFHRLTGVVGVENDAKTNVISLTVAVHLISWFGQFAYLAYTCDKLTARSSEMFNNLNSLLLNTYKESRIFGETYSSKIQEIETVQEFMRQVVDRKVIVHACGGLITLNLFLITTIIGVTLTYFIVLLQFESSYSNINNNTNSN